MQYMDNMGIAHIRLKRSMILPCQQITTSVA